MSTAATDPKTPLESPHAWILLTLPVALISVFAELGYAVVNNSALPVYFKDGLQIDTAITPIIMAPFFVSEALFKGPLGVLADKLGRKPLMVFGPAVSIFTPLILILIRYHVGTTDTPALVVFGFLRLLDGFGAAALWPALFAYVGDRVRAEKRGAAMSLLNVTYMVGLAFGFLAGGWVNDTFGPVLSGEASFRHQIKVVAEHLRAVKLHRPHMPFALPAAHKTTETVTAHAGAGISGARPHDFGFVFHPAQYFPSFYLASVLFALATIVAVLAIQGRKSSAADADGKASEGGGLNLKSLLDAARSVPFVLLLAFVTFFGIGCIALLVKVFALDEFGLSETGFGVLILWPAIAISLLAVPLGHLSDKWGSARSVRLGFFIGAVSMWAMVWLYRVPGVRESALAVSGTLLGLGFVIAFPAWLTYLTTLSGEAQRGTIIGAASTAQGLGVLLGTLFGGFLYNHAFADAHTAHIAPFVACALFLTVGSLLTFFVLHTAKPQEPAASAS